MTDISTRTESWNTRRGYWITSRHGQDVNESIVIDTSAMDATTHYPDGYLLDGIPLGEISASPGVYTVWDTDASDGTETIAGFLYDNPTVVVNGTLIDKVGAAMFVHGFVDLDALITGIAVDDGFDEPVTKADLPPLIGARSGKE